MFNRRLSLTCFALGVSLTVAQFAISATSEAQSNAPPTGVSITSPTLIYEKMVYLQSDSIKTVPTGYIWRVQAVLTSEAALQEGGAGSFLSGLKNESEASVLFRADMRLKSLWVGGGVFYVSAFPFDLDEGTKVSAASKKPRIVVIAQYKIQ